MADTACLLYFDDEKAAALRLAAAAGMEALAVTRHRFPDGELKLRLPARLAPRVAMLRSLDHPDGKLVELLLCASAARGLGASHLTLVAPYLAYMRQDTAFEPGEAVSQRIVGRFIASLFDALVTVDPHLHRTATLQEAVPVRQAIALSGAPLLGDWIAARLPQALLVGPDGESLRWVAQAAARHQLGHAVCSKRRHGDLSVEIELPDAQVRGRAVVLVDDVASSGRTLARAAQLLLAAGAASVDVAVTHALFAGDALAFMRQAGIREVWSTDCIAHPTNVVDMAPPLAHALRSLPGT